MLGCHVSGVTLSLMSCSYLQIVIYVLRQAVVVCLDFNDLDLFLSAQMVISHFSDNNLSWVVVYVALINTSPASLDSTYGSSLPFHTSDSFSSFPQWWSSWIISSAQRLFQEPGSRYREDSEYKLKQTQPFTPSPGTKTSNLLNFRLNIPVHAPLGLVPPPIIE